MDSLMVDFKDAHDAVLAGKSMQAVLASTDLLLRVSVEVHRLRALFEELNRHKLELESTGKEQLIYAHNNLISMRNSLDSLRDTLSSMVQYYV